MKVLIIAKEDYLGAGKAALRVYQALKRSGNEVCLLVKNRVNENNPDIIQYDDIIISSPVLRAKQFIHNRISRVFQCKIETDANYSFLGLNDRSSKVYVKKVVEKLPFMPEVIIITWTSQFFNARALYHLQVLTKAKMIAYPMDMSLFTGGCHYAWDCKGYQYECNNCPAILDNSKKYIAHKNFKDKYLYYKKSNLNIISASNQLQLEATKSSIYKKQGYFKKALLPIDENIFNSADRDKAKLKFGLPQEAKVILFGASFTTEKRKGVDLFIYSLIELKKRYSEKDDLSKSIVIMFTGHKPPDLSELEKIPFVTHFTGYINDDKILSLTYQAADVFVCTSIQDSGPMMINESVMCGTPVVSFDLGVASDLIIEGISGFKVPVFDVENLAHRIYDILNYKRSILENINSLTSELAYKKTSFSAFETDFKKDREEWTT